MVGCSTQLVFSTAKKSGLTRRPQTTQVTTATTRIDKIDAQIRALQQRREEIREKQRVQLKATQDGKILIWMNGQGVTGTNEQMDQLRVLLQEKAEGQAVGAA